MMEMCNTLSVSDMLRTHNSWEEELGDEPEALDIARLTLYRLPVEWYRKQVQAGNYYSLLRFWVHIWVMFTYVDMDVYTSIEEGHVRGKIEGRFVRGDMRDELAAMIEQKQCSWPCIQDVCAEVTYWNARADVCERGLAECVDAWAAGVPLEYVFPDYRGAFPDVDVLGVADVL